MTIDVVIDISHWQGVVDFNALANSGIVGVIHKATESTGYVDDTYHRNKQDAERAGLLWGAYHFLRPGDMRAQARHFVDTVGTIHLYAADHEDEGVSLDDLKEFLREVEARSGRTPIVYSGHVIKDQLAGHGRDTDLAHYPLWLAQYTSSNPSWPTETWPQWWLWQYTDKGSVPGIDGAVDRNRYQGTADELYAEWTGDDAGDDDAKPPQATVIITITIEAIGAKVSVEAKAAGSADF